MEEKVRVGITHGDINGVGYEIILKAIGDEGFTEICTPIIFGSPRLVDKCRRDLNMEGFKYRKVKYAAEADDGEISVVDVNRDNVRLTPGITSPEAGEAAVAALEAAAQALEDGVIDVLVTAPICKESTNSPEFNFPGHTEYLQERLGKGAKSLMILFDDNVRIALVTTHLPISKVAEAITEEKVEATIRALSDSLKMDFMISRPKIAVLSLNPHCGDGGLLGGEENDVIIPAIEKSCKEGIFAFGPFAADGFFSSGAFRKYDGVVAMYHDQGLAPFKALAGENGVNFTAGLPFVRTSPDHGTAFDIAWQGEADPTSMRQAIYRAIDIYRSRCRYEEARENPLSEVTIEKDKGRDKQRKEPRQPRQEGEAPAEKAPAAAEKKEPAPQEAPALNFGIIAAGEGSRLRQEGVSLPKPLVNIEGTPMIRRLIDIFCRCGAKSVAVIVNEEMTEVAEYLEKVREEILPVKLEMIVKSTPSSMHSFWHLSSLLKGKGRFIVTTVDTIFREEEFAAYARAYAEAPADVQGMMAITPFIDDEKPLYVETDADMRIVAFRDEAWEGVKYVSGGIYGLSDAAVDVLGRCVEQGVSRMRNYQRALVADGLDIRGYEIPKIVDVDHSADIATAEEFLASK